MVLTEERNKLLAQIKPTLIESFTQYYGEDYRKRIENILNSITYIYTNINSTGNYEIYGSSNDERLKNDYSLKERISNQKNAKLCTFPNTYPPVIIISGKEQLNANELIHEINHILSHERIAIKTEEIDKLYSSLGITVFNNKKYIDQEGININDGKTDDSDNVLAYEIINEYMARDILEIFKNYEHNSNIDFNYSEASSQYLSLDKILGNIVKNIYLRMPNEIKNNLINANGQTIKKIIGSDCFIELNGLLKTFYNSYTKFSEKAYKKQVIINPEIIYKTFEEREEILLQEFLNSCKKDPKIKLLIAMTENLEEEIIQNYQEYLEYTAALNNYIDSNSNIQRIGK